MANTFIQIGSTVTVGSGGATSIAFTSIPATFTDLCLKLSARDNSASTRSIARVTFNSSASSYSSKALYGVNGSTTGTENGASTYIDWSYITAANATASTFGNTEIYIPNYASSNNKFLSIDFVAENNSATSGIIGIATGLWSNSAAITSITLDRSTDSFVQYSTATLYGIKNS